MTTATIIDSSIVADDSNNTASVYAHWQLQWKLLVQRLGQEQNCLGICTLATAMETASEKLTTGTKLLRYMHTGNCEGNCWCGANDRNKTASVYAHWQLQWKLLVRRLRRRAAACVSAVRKCIARLKVATNAQRDKYTYLNRWICTNTAMTTQFSASCYLTKCQRTVWWRLNSKFLLQSLVSCYFLCAAIPRGGCNTPYFFTFLKARKFRHCVNLHF